MSGGNRRAVGDALAAAFTKTVDYAAGRFADPATGVTVIKVLQLRLSRIASSAILAQAGDRRGAPAVFAEKYPHKSTVVSIRHCTRRDARVVGFIAPLPFNWRVPYTYCATC